MHLQTHVDFKGGYPADFILELGVDSIGGLQDCSDHAEELARKSARLASSASAACPGRITGTVRTSRRVTEGR